MTDDGYCNHRIHVRDWLSTIRLPATQISEMLTQDQRENWLPTVDNYARKVNQYAAYTLSETEYIGTFEYDYQQRVNLFLSTVEDIGYEYSGLAALKYHPETGNADDGSYRKVDPENPTWQWHVHIFKRDGHIEVYSHYEKRPDLTRIVSETLSEMYSRLRTHYRPEYNVTYLRGETCDEIEALF